MAGARGAGRRKPERSGAIGASLAIHAVLLAVLGWHVAPRLEGAPPPADIQLALALPPPTARTSVRLAARAPATVAAPVAASARSPEPIRKRTQKAAPEPVPAVRGSASAVAAAPAAAAAAGAGPAGVSGAPHPGPLPSAEASGDVRGLLRATVGCEHRDAVALTPAERERCDARLGALARAAPPVDLMPPDKRGAYGAAADAAARRRAMRDDPLYRPVVACQGAGSNLGLGCLPPDAIHHVGIP